MRVPSRKAALVHSAGLAAERARISISPNCSLLHLHREQVAAIVKASHRIGLQQPVLPDGLAYVQLFRQVRAGQELVLCVRDALGSIDESVGSTSALPQLSFLSSARTAPRALTPIPYLPPIDCVPVEIVELGIQRWTMARRSAAEAARPLHRDALDDALADFQMELESHLSDGARNEIRQYQQARRQASRDVAAAHSSHMEGERRCELLKVLLNAVADPAKHTRGV